MKNNLRISVIIPTVNRSEYLKNALRSILNQSLPRVNYEIIVVDSSNDEKTKNLVEEINTENNSNIIYHNEPKPGLHEGRNTGANLAKADILLYCDDDIIASNNWIEEILKCYHLFPNCGAAGGKIVGKWEDEPKDWILSFGENIENIFPLSLLNRGKGIYKLDTYWYVFGCNFSIQKELVYKMGGTFPDAYPSKLRYLNGNGETGALKQVDLFGYDIIYNSKACVQHIVTKKRNTEKYFIKRFEDEAYRSIFSNFRDASGNKLILIRIIISSLVNYFKIQTFSFIKKKNRVYYTVQKHHEKIKILHGIRVLFDAKIQEHILKKNYL